MEEEAKEAPISSDKLLFLPYLAGERHPHTDTNARGAFFGHHTGHGKPHLARAILDGVAFSFADCLEVIKEHDIEIQEIRAPGGGAQLSLWMELQVNVSGESIVLMDASAGGAALLGVVCAGDYSGVKEACSELVKTRGKLIPDSEKIKKYNAFYGLFRTMYPLLKDSYQSLAVIDPL